MSKVRCVGGPNSYLWETTAQDCTVLSLGDHKIEVQAIGSTKRSDSITVEVAAQF